MYALLKRKMDGLKVEALELAGALVRTASTTYHEGEAAALVRSRLVELGYDKVTVDDSGNVVGVLFGREAEPTLLLTSHLDTVAPDSSAGWIGNPLAGQFRDGRLYGLGAADCKGGLAAQLYAGVLIRRALLPLRGNIVFAATTAEGNGRSVGIRGLLENTLPAMGLEPTAAILGEPTSLGLYYGHDGWVRLELRIEGTNPVRVHEATRALLDTWAELPGEADALASISRPSFEESAAQGRATITLNRRIASSERLDDVLRHIRHNALLATRSSHTTVEVGVSEATERMYNGRPHLVRHLSNGWAIDPYDPLVERARQSLAAAGMEARPGRWKLGRFGMGTAGNVLVNEFHVPTIGYGPGEEEQAHAANESVDASRIIDAIYGTAAIAHGIAGIPVFGWTSDEI